MKAIIKQSSTARESGKRQVSAELKFNVLDMIYGLPFELPNPVIGSNPELPSQSSLKAGRNGL